MKKINSLSLYQLKLHMRDPQDMFFIMVFPTIMYLVFSNLLGDMLNPDTSISIIEYLVPAYIPIIIGNTAIIIFGLMMVNHKEHRYFIKYKLLGFKPIQVAMSLFTSVAICQTLGILVLVLVAVVTKGIKVPFDNIINVTLALGIINLFQFSLAFFLSSIFKKSTTYQTVGLIIFYMQMFLGGLTFPPEMFSDAMRKLVEIFNPIIHGLYIMRGVWVEGKNIFAFPLEILILIGVSGALILAGTKLFSWEA